MLRDAVHYLLRLQVVVVEDEGDAAPHHLQPASAVEHRAALAHDGDWTEQGSASGDNNRCACASLFLTLKCCCQLVNNFGDN